MWGFDLDGIDERSSMSYRTDSVIKRIKEIKSKNLISLSENVELSNLQKELDLIRASCSHYYEPILLFNRHHSYCRYCDKEDYSYRHQS